MTSKLAVRLMVFSRATRVVNLSTLERNCRRLISIFSVGALKPLRYLTYSLSRPLTSRCPKIMDKLTFPRNLGLSYLFISLSMFLLTVYCILCVLYSINDKAGIPTIVHVVIRNWPILISTDLSQSRSMR